VVAVTRDSKIWLNADQIMVKDQLGPRFRMFWLRRLTRRFTSRAIDGPDMGMWWMLWILYAQLAWIRWAC
jgi:hypothetical protein